MLYVISLSQFCQARDGLGPSSAIDYLDGNNKDKQEKQSKQNRQSMYRVGTVGGLIDAIGSRGAGEKWCWVMMASRKFSARCA